MGLSWLLSYLLVQCECPRQSPMTCSIPAPCVSLGERWMVWRAEQSRMCQGVVLLLWNAVPWELSALHKQSEQHHGLPDLQSWGQTGTKALCRCPVAPFWRAGWISGLSRSWLEASMSSGAVLGAGSSQVGMCSTRTAPPTSSHPALPTPLLWHFARKIGNSSFCRVWLRGRQCCMDPVRSVLIF